MPISFSSQLSIRPALLVASAKSFEASGEKAIRAEIKRYYYAVGDTIGGDALNAALSDALDPDISRQTRQDILNSIAQYANSDPAGVAQARNLAVGGILLFSALPTSATAVRAPSEVWKLGWAARGAYINEQLGANLPANFPVVDVWIDGAVTSIKSIDLTAATCNSFYVSS